jgi:hypothetical protein
MQVVRLSKIYSGISSIILQYYNNINIIILLKFDGLKGFKKMSDNKDKPIYLFNGMPLQSKYNNNYTRAEKIEIILQLRKRL